MYIFNIFNSVRLRNSIHLHVVLKQERTSLVELKPKCFCLHRMAGTKRLTGELMMIEHFITYYRVPACLLLNNRISAVATTLNGHSTLNLTRDIVGQWKWGKSLFGIRLTMCIVLKIGVLIFWEKCYRQLKQQLL